MWPPLPFHEVMQCHTCTVGIPLLYTIYWRLLAGIPILYYTLKVTSRNALKIRVLLCFFSVWRKCIVMLADLPFIMMMISPFLSSHFFIWVISPNEFTAPCWGQINNVLHFFPFSQTDHQVRMLSISSGEERKEDGTD